MNLLDVDYFAILVAALSSFMLGGIWYSKALFKNAWLESIGLTDLDLQSANPKLIFWRQLLFSIYSGFNVVSIFR